MLQFPVGKIANKQSEGVDAVVGQPFL